jgi:hypothetical protein
MIKMEEKQSSKKEQIIEYLKKEGEQPLYRLCGMLRMNQFYGERYCMELVDSKEAELRLDGKTKYFKLKGDKREKKE